MGSFCIENNSYINRIHNTHKNVKLLLKVDKLFDFKENTLKVLIKNNFCSEILIKNLAIHEYLIVSFNEILDTIKCVKVSAQIKCVIVAIASWSIFLFWGAEIIGS